MTENKQSPIDKKIMENSFVGSLVVPIAIVLIGALVIFGVTKMISTDQSYKDLVREMQSKTFGNKWVAALELSKVISAGKIPEEDVPWLVENLESVYRNTIDTRTKDFVVVALGALRTPLSLSLLKDSISEEDKNIVFHSIVAIGNIPHIEAFDWSKLMGYLNNEDHALVQATVLALGTHRVVEAQSQIESLLNNEGSGIKFAAATSLIYFRSDKALPVLEEVLKLKYVPSEEAGKSPLFTVDQIAALKLNVINAAVKVEWGALLQKIGEISVNDEDVKIVSKAKEVLNLLKK